MKFRSAAKSIAVVIFAGLFGFSAGSLSASLTAVIHIPHPVDVAYAADVGIPAKVLRIADGDTITVSVPGRGKVKVRLLEVDTFEVYQSSSMDHDVRQFRLSKSRLKELGHIGSAFTKNLVHKGDTVWLIYSGRRTGIFGRDLAFVRLSDGRVLNEELVKAGAALVYRGAATPEHGRYLRMEAAARNARLGVWADDHVRAHFND